MTNVWREDRKDVGASISRARAKKRRAEVRTFLALQFIAWLLGDALLTALFRGSQGRWEMQGPILAMLVGALVGQLSVAAGWSAVGDGPWLGRLMQVFATSLLAACCFLGIEEFRDARFLLAGTIMMVCLAAGMAIPHGIMRILGIACRNLDITSTAERTPARTQFRVWDLLVVTALVAIVLGVLRLLPEPYFARVLYILDHTLWIVMSGPIFGATVACVPWLLWTSILNLRVEYAWTVVVLVLIGLCLLFFLPGGFDAGASSPAFGVLAVPAFVFTLATHLFLLRKLGYRLVRLPSKPAASQT